MCTFFFFSENLKIVKNEKGQLAFYRYTQFFLQNNLVFCVSENFKIYSVDEL